jgi:hypothetical protein
MQPLGQDFSKRGRSGVFAVIYCGCKEITKYD